MICPVNWLPCSLKRQAPPTSPSAGIRGSSASYNLSLFSPHPSSEEVAAASLFPTSLFSSLTPPSIPFRNPENKLYIQTLLAWHISLTSAQLGTPAVVFGSPAASGLPVSMVSHPPLPCLGHPPFLNNNIVARQGQALSMFLLPAGRPTVRGYIGTLGSDCLDHFPSLEMVRISSPSQLSLTFTPGECFPWLQTWPDHLGRSSHHSSSLASLALYSLSSVFVLGPEVSQILLFCFSFWNTCKYSLLWEIASAVSNLWFLSHLDCSQPSSITNPIFKGKKFLGQTLRFVLFLQLSCFWLIEINPQKLSSTRL